MNILCWNCQELGNPWTVHGLGEYIKTHHPSLVFLAETKCNSSRVDLLKRKFGMFGFSVASVGKSGGLALLWEKTISVQLQSYSAYHIDVSIQADSDPSPWRFTGFYGMAEASKRTESWSLLRQLRSQSIRPWLCAGDFNEILLQAEKTGRSLRPLWQMRNFREALSDCDLHDLGYSGEDFTWCNRQEIPNTISIRLDRACGDSRWKALFPTASVENLSSIYSDHLPILINPAPTSGQKSIGGKVFRFEASWLQSEDCPHVVETSWQSIRSGNVQKTFIDKLNSSRAALSSWGRNSFKERRHRIEVLEKILTKIRSRPLTGEVKNKEDKVRRELEGLLLEDEVYWRQRGKIQWLKGGDKNTSFFHRAASNRKRINSIFRLRDAHGNWIEKNEEIRNWIETYFRGIFSSCRPSVEEIEEGTAALSSKVTQEMEDDLLQPFTEEEVTNTLFQMSPLKSPGPDGMPPIFYHKHWHIINKDVIRCTLSILNNVEMLHELNHTSIVLIPKCSKAETLSQFRPISLCNVVYKIVSKALANRMKHLLDKIISPTQAAFVPGRLITDNVLLAYEINHFLHTKRKGRKGHSVIKLDISKAYDKIEWPFLEKVLFKLGFPDKIVRLILLCVTTVSYSFILSGTQFGHVLPQRGLRQGDPLSPYLFLLCTEAFSSLVHRAETTGRLRGVAISREAPPISHLLFADDTLLCCQATREAMECIKEILDCYGRASGQEVNFNKSTAVFSGNVQRDVQKNLSELLGIRLEEKHDKYLGLPSIVGKSRRAVFNCIRDRVWSRIQGWSDKLLSQAGKTVLIKSVLQAIPTYAMGCFRLPFSLINEIQSMIADYLWHRRDERKIHWIAWRKLCTQKKCGGLGFRDLKAFNAAMLAKQFWRILTEPERLLSRVKARYFPNSSILEAKPGYNPSFTWRSILASKEIIKAGARWSVGSGREINIWTDPWIPRSYCFKAITQPNSLHELRTVDSLIDPVSKEWNRNLVLATFHPSDSEAILGIPLSKLGRRDKIVWHHTC
ncbi:UNVERIFIED_CONTAM: LINE-1 retrotransposable element O protein [Sesamum radiatum]|uniref:LINE-1 retrotransposable element O protein n=1 Tax=Sesamum radiatum TaxID=300843 RepID=A0AAW2PKP3_SESRA